MSVASKSAMLTSTRALAKLPKLALRMTPEVAGIEADTANSERWVTPRVMRTLASWSRRVGGEPASVGT